jgi:hypothetical protein
MSSLSTGSLGALRAQFLMRVVSAGPSTKGKPAEFVKRQNDLNQQIFCNRPYDASDTIPVTLVHPVFAEFIDDCETYEPTLQDYDFVSKFRVAMTHIYMDEDTRGFTLREKLSDYGIRLRRSKVKGTKCETDGDAMVGTFLYTLMQINNEASAGGAEPYFQAILYYLEFTRLLAPKRWKSALPCLIILIVGW